MIDFWDSLGKSVFVLTGDLLYVESIPANVKSINKMLIEVEKNVIFPVVKIDIFYAILYIC